ncbi:hypothetical protein AAG570_001209 [Ranatra chinensis]|uniref:Pro-resilin n=1 Tax=Ranatra chinensis TaxID=642074 RepID=A0ABD0YB72_9HEMI
MRDGDYTQGSYNVVLPDGRKQIVDYEADSDGYKPKVRYEGEEEFRGRENLIGTDGSGAPEGGIGSGVGSETGPEAVQTSSGNGEGGQYHSGGIQDAGGYPTGDGRQLSRTNGANGQHSVSNGRHQGYPSGRPSVADGGSHQPSNGHNGQSQPSDAVNGRSGLNGNQRGYSSGKPQHSGSRQASSHANGGHSSSRALDGPSVSGRIPGSNGEHQGYPSGRPFAANGQSHLPINHDGTQNNGELPNGGNDGYPSSSGVPGSDIGQSGYTSGRPDGANGGLQPPFQRARQGSAIGLPPRTNGYGAEKPITSGEAFGPANDGSHQGGAVLSNGQKHVSSGMQPGYPAGGTPGNGIGNQRHFGTGESSSSGGRINGGHPGYPSGRPGDATGSAQRPSSQPSVSSTGVDRNNGGGAGYPSGNEQYTSVSTNHPGYPSGQPGGLEQHSGSARMNGRAQQGHGGYEPGAISDQLFNGRTKQPLGPTAADGSHNNAGGYPSTNGQATNGEHRGYPSGRPNGSSGRSLVPSGAGGTGSSHTNGEALSHTNGYPSTDGHRPGANGATSGYPAGRPSAINGGLGFEATGANGSGAPHENGAHKGYPARKPGDGHPSGSHSAANGRQPHSEPERPSHSGYPAAQSPSGITGGSPSKPQGSGNGDLSEDGYHY